MKPASPRFFFFFFVEFFQTYQLLKEQLWVLLMNDNCLWVQYLPSGGSLACINIFTRGRFVCSISNNSTRYLGDMSVTSNILVLKLQHFTIEVYYTLEIQQTTVFELNHAIIDIRARKDLLGYHVYLLPYGIVIYNTLLHLELNASNDKTPTTGPRTFSFIVQRTCLLKGFPPPLNSFEVYFLLNFTPILSCLNPHNLTSILFPLVVALFKISIHSKAIL